VVVNDLDAVDVQNNVGVAHNESPYMRKGLCPVRSAVLVTALSTGGSA